MIRHLTFLSIVVLGGLAVSCTTAESPAVDARDLDPFSPEAFCAYETGDPTAGKALFDQLVLGSGAGCITCHSLEAGQVLVGPSLYNLVETAENRIPGVLAANYIYLSITQPNHYIVQGFPEGLMPPTYSTDLTDEEITNLVSYLMTLSAEN
ncbi:MAG: cytochrome c [Ardenticatenaceae bacterium]|nr:cytochrome c [Ardenticatenaceae bacterium]